MSGWIADCFRFAWALFYWNGRKSLFRLRRGRGACPCQSASDSGRALETHCDACVMWARPARFQRVCPLLVDTPAGLRCSVNAAEVRPFWGRALRYAGGGLAVAYLAASLAAFTALRVIGYPVSYVAVAWPPAWSRIDEARGRYFLQQGHDALARNAVKEALFSFALAHELAPRDYDISFALASLWQLTQPALSDRYYAALLRDHPERASQTADAWHRALLARGDFQIVKHLAVDRFLHGDDIHAGYWLHSLMFASQRTRDVSPLQFLLGLRPPLAAQWQRVLAAEVLQRTGRAADAVDALRTVWPEAASPYVPFYQADSLIDLGRGRSALQLVDDYGARLRDDERYRLRLRAFAVLGWHSLLKSDVELLLTPPPTAAVIELLGTHLTRNPDPVILNRVFARLAETPLRPAPENRAAFATLFCATGAAGDFTRMHEMALALRKVSGTSAHTITAFEEFFEGRAAQKHIEACLPALPLPLELTYVLLERYATSSPPGAKP